MSFLYADRVLERIFGPPDAPARPEKLFALLDGAREFQIHLTCGETPGARCLYHGDLAPDLAAAAPWLGPLERGSALTSLLVDQGWGDSYGVVVESPAPAAELEKHFRKLLIVKRESGEKVYFRFYDPRVLRIFLPTCTTEELDQLFGPVRRFVLEAADDQSFLELRRGSDGALEQEVIAYA